MTTVWTLFISTVWTLMSFSFDIKTYVPFCKTNTVCSCILHVLAFQTKKTIDSLTQSWLTSPVPQPTASETLDNKDNSFGPTDKSQTLSMKGQKRYLHSSPIFWCFRRQERTWSREVGSLCEAVWIKWEEITFQLTLISYSLHWWLLYTRIKEPKFFCCRG